MESPQSTSSATSPSLLARVRRDDPEGWPTSDEIAARPGGDRDRIIIAPGEIAAEHPIART
ncbi:MAG: hypothetical protein ACKVII_03595 [Planctomycetales bacterium]